MGQTLPLEADDPEAAEMRTAIAQWLAQVAELRQQMRRHDAAIEEASAETRGVLAQIAEILADLKAA
jgi:chromosome segregation ATPase